MSTKQKTIGEIPSDELVRQQLATAKIHQPFHDFVRSIMNLSPFDYDIILDQTDAQGWRVIDMKVFTVTGDTYLSSIFLPPGRTNRFPPNLDIPF